MQKESCQVYLLDGTRTPFGKYRGALSPMTSLDLGQAVITEMVRRHPNAAHADAALFGVVVQAGLGQNAARIAATRAGVALTTPALTLNDVCLASLEAVCDAARRIRSGEGNRYLVGGFDSMTRAAWVVPDEDIAPGTVPRSTMRSEGLHCALSGLSMGALSERYNRELGIARQEQDEWAVQSQQRAARAAVITEREEITPLSINGAQINSDQGIRPDSSLKKIAQLKPVFEEHGTITAANASQMSDGASAGLIISEQERRRLDGTAPLARIVDWAWVAGPTPSLHLQPAHAVQKLLYQQNLVADDIDLFEINEAFAAVVIASVRELGLDYSKVNVDGGAIAIGHPLGASGFRLLLTLALQLRRRGLQRGIATLCGGGGQGLAILIENAT